MPAREGGREAYSGETSRQLREGFGIYKYPNKFFHYEGEWNEGKKHGHGKFVMGDGSYYEGQFEDGEIEGHGFRYFATSGNNYSGQFHQGHLHGQGVMKYKNGDVYEGEWYMNRRQGYGSYRTADNSVYQGYLHDNKRHGEGTMVFSNGDRYDGDWVQDKRQGHGELRCRDGTIYDGQWRNDLFNGQGSMTHCSGMKYEGLWVNGKPVALATKIVIKATDPLEVSQGVPFEIEVECQNEDGERVQGDGRDDEGRELHIVAGFKYVPPKEGSTVSTTSVKDTPSAAALFDMIEDAAEKPIPTPFGYDMMTYPLTDQPMEDVVRDIDSSLGPGLGSKSHTMLSEMAIAEDETEPAETAEEGEEKEPVEQATVEVESEESKDKTEVEAAPAAAPPEGATEGGEPTNGEEAKPESPPAQETSTVVTSSDPQPEAALPAGDPLPPPVTNIRTSKGGATFQNLLLTAPPPMYRPFTKAEDEEKGPKRTKSRSSSKLKKDDDDSRPGTRKKEKSFGDERFARPGEYVVMVTDVTEPPFMGFNLQPAYALVKLFLPKKVKKATPKKDKGPKWDTSRHIAQAMARSYTDVANEQ